MEFILITFLTISITTIIVYKFANKLFGLQLRLKPLILCAVCAVLISLVLPRVVVGFAGTIGTLGFLVVFAVVFAYFIACYDNSYESHTTQSNNPVAAAIPFQGNGFNFEEFSMEECAENSCLQNGKHSVNSEAVADQDCQPENILSSELDDVLGEELEKSVEEIEQVSGKDEQTSTVELQQELKTYKDGIQLLAMENAQTDDLMEEDPKAEEKVIAEKIDSPGVDIHRGQQFDLLTGISREELQGGQNVLEIHKPLDDQEDSIQEVCSKCDSLDELMDIAFSLKERGNYNQALYAFYQALKMYSNNEAAPLLVIEIGNILKNKGAYDDAVNIFAEGRNLPVLKDDHLLEQEFVNTIAYLRIVKNSLLAQHYGVIPYGDIPAAVLKQIDAEFREWRDLAS